MDSALGRSIKPQALRALYQAAENAGCVLSLTRKSRVRIDTPAGGVVFGPQTSSDHRSLKNVRAQLRQKGVPL